MGRTYLRGEKRAAALAKGGITSMFGKQAAGPDRPGNTGKDQSAALGAKSARGGTTEMASGFQRFRPLLSRFSRLRLLRCWLRCWLRSEKLRVFARFAIPASHIGAV